MAELLVKMSPVVDGDASRELIRPVPVGCTALPRRATMTRLALLFKEN